MLIWPQLRVTGCKGFGEAEFGQEGLEAIGGTDFGAAGVAGQDEFVFHAVLPAHQFGDRHGVAFGL